MKSRETADNSNQANQTGIGRRKFLAYTASAGAGLLVTAAGISRAEHILAAASDQTVSAVGESAVVVVRSGRLFSEGENPGQRQVREMLVSGMENLFGTKDTTAALRKLFKSDDVVGIKVNCIAGRNLSTHPEVVAAIVSELEKVPVPRENIIIWDRTNRELVNAGYAINMEKAEVRCYGTDAVGYEDKATAKGKFNGRLSKILTEQITALINVPILKDHGGAGVTISMKNHYGSFHNPGRHHGNMCDPYIADLNSLDEIAGKTRLIVCDATRAACNGGPGYKPAFAWRYSGVIISTDPVALDTVGTRIIEDRRTEVGMPRLAESGRYPRQLASAAERGLGVASLDRINITTVLL